MLDMLGKQSDRKVAKIFGISSASVAKKRRSLGIADYMSNRWTPEIIAMLGKRSDASIAKLMGVSSETVFEKRKRLFILPCKPSLDRPPVKAVYPLREGCPNPDRLKQIVELLNSGMNQSRVAERLGVSRQRVAQILDQWTIRKQ